MEPNETEATPYVFPKLFREGMLLTRPNGFIVDVPLDRKR